MIEVMSVMALNCLIHYFKDDNDDDRLNKLTLKPHSLLEYMIWCYPTKQLVQFRLD